MRSLRTINGVVAAARDAPLQADQMSDEALVVEQFDPAAVNQWQVAVEVGLRLRCRLVADVTLARPLAGSRIS